MSKNPLGCLVSAAFAVAAPSQATWHVYPPGNDLTTTIAAATPGDTIVLHQGFYMPFAASRGVRLVTDGGWVIFHPNATTPPSPVWLVMLQIPPGEVFSLSDVDVQFPVLAAGHVQFDACRVSRIAADDAELHLQATTISSYSGYQPMLALDASSATLLDCTIDANGWGSVAPAVRVTDGSSLQASHCTVRNGSAAQTSNAALHVDASSDAWLCDSLLATIDTAACAIDGAAHVERCTFEQNGSNCAPPLAGPVLGVTRPAPLRRGTTFSATFTTDANGVVFVLAAPTVKRVDVPPLLAQPSWLPIATVFPVTALLADASGVATIGFPVPANPALQHATLWLEGIGLAAGPLPVSAPFGGEIR